MGCVPWCNFRWYYPFHRSKMMAEFFAISDRVKKKFVDHDIPSLTKKRIKTVITQSVLGRQHIWGHRRVAPITAFSDTKHIGLCTTPTQLLPSECWKSCLTNPVSVNRPHTLLASPLSPAISMSDSNSSHFGNSSSPPQDDKSSLSDGWVVHLPLGITMIKCWSLSHLLSIQNCAFHDH